MVTATAIDVFEVARSAGAADRVDREKGIIRRVKILGIQSRNIGRTIGLSEDEYGDAVNKPYRYSREALESARQFYEGARVYTDHPEFQYDGAGHRMPSKRDRTTTEMLGRLQNVTVESDGLYGDLHYLKSHPMAGVVCEAAERMPDVFALSHNASVQTELIGGEVVVTEILGVRSVDLVGDTPGTTHGLFESAAPQSKGKTMKKTIRAIVESTPAKTPGRSVLEMMLDQEEEQVAEMEAPPADEELVAEQEVELADSPAPSADEQIAAAFAAAVTAIVADPALSVEEKKKKIIALLNAEEKVADASATDTAPATESDAEEVPAEEETESAASETVVRKADRGAVVLESIGLLNTAGVPVMESYVEAMASLPNKARRQAFANDLKRSAGTGVEIVARSREGKQVAETASKAKSPKVDFGRNPDLGERALRGMSAVE